MMKLIKQIEERIQSYSIVNVIVAGSSCSGKTTFANELKDYFSDKFPVTIIAQDDYFKDLPDVPRIKEGYLLDSINAFQTEEFENDVRSLIKKGFTRVPQYSIMTNTRIDKSRIFRCGTINIFEGLHTIQILDELENSIKVFLDTDIDTCLERRIERDTGKYNVSEEVVKAYWFDCILPMYKEYILPQKELADIVIER